jgi:steroid delta-isomerase-like uncharacterized protein
VNEKRGIMSTEANKAVVRRYIMEVLNLGQIEAIDLLFGPAIRERVRWFATMFRRAFPDMQETIEALVAEGDAVAARWTFRGTHLGEFRGIAPTGKAIEMTGMSLYLLTDGKIQNDWAEWDELGLLQQLGALPLLDEEPS